MQWYVSLVTIAAAGVLGWIVLELLGKPIRAFFDLRDQVGAQLLLLANVAPPKPRETVSTSLEIRQYDMALKAGREAQRILRDLGSQMLAFSEIEIAACNWIAAFGFDAVAAGRGLIALSNLNYRSRTDCAGFSSKIEDALCLKARGGSARREMVEYIAARLKADGLTPVARLSRLIALARTANRALANYWTTSERNGPSGEAEAVLRATLAV